MLLNDGALGRTYGTQIPWLLHCYKATTPIELSLEYFILARKLHENFYFWLAKGNPILLYIPLIPVDGLNS